MSRAKYDEDGFRIDPIPTRRVNAKNRRDDRFWFYEDPDGISVVHRSGELCHIPAMRLREYVRVYESANVNAKRGNGEGGGR